MQNAELWEACPKAALVWVLRNSHGLPRREIRKHEGLKEVCDSDWHSRLCVVRATVCAQKKLSNVQSSRVPEQGQSLPWCRDEDGCSFATCVNTALWVCVAVQNCQRKLSLHIRKLLTDGALLTQRTFLGNTEHFKIFMKADGNIYLSPHGYIIIIPILLQPCQSEHLLESCKTCELIN